MESVESRVTSTHRLVVLLMGWSYFWCACEYQKYDRPVEEAKVLAGQRDAAPSIGVVTTEQAISSPRPARPAPQRRRRRSPGWVPNHHGAWAMITVPVLAGVILSGPAPVHAPLLLTWWSGYFAFFATGLWLRSRRKPKYWPPVRTYWIVTAVGGVATLVMAPHLLVWAVPMSPLIATTFWCSSVRRDRSMLNDIVTVTAGGLTTAVAYDAGVGGAGGVMGTGWLAGWGWWPVASELPGASADAAIAGWGWSWVVTALLTAYFIGTIFYVKTNIRERGNGRFFVASVAFHAVAAAAAIALAADDLVTWWHAGVWAVVLARAVAVPVLSRQSGRVRPMYVGIGEIVASLLIAVTLLWA